MMIQPESEQITAHTAGKQWEIGLQCKKQNKRKKEKQRSNRTTDTHMRQPGLEINMSSSSFHNLVPR